MTDFTTFHAVSSPQWKHVPLEVAQQELALGATHGPRCRPTFHVVGLPTVEAPIAAAQHIDAAAAHGGGRRHLPTPHNLAGQPDMSPTALALPCHRVLCTERSGAGWVSGGSRCHRAIEAAATPALAAVETGGGSLAASTGSYSVLQLLVWLMTTWLSLICGGLGGEHGFSDTAQNACCIIYLKLRDVRRGVGVCLIWCLRMKMGFTDLQRLSTTRLDWHDEQTPVNNGCVIACKSAACSSCPF